jgi:uncharacterized protein (UPF0297 family)
MSMNETMLFKMEKDKRSEAKEILEAVNEALNEKGYNPINQIVGYLISCDPSYITSNKNARSIIRRMERDELLEEIVKSYIESNLFIDKKID